MRHFSTAASSRKNDRDRILPFSERLSNRSNETKPSIFSRIGLSSAARSRYCCLCSGLGLFLFFIVIFYVFCLSSRPTMSPFARSFAPPPGSSCFPRRSRNLRCLPDRRGAVRGNFHRPQDY